MLFTDTIKEPILSREGKKLKPPIFLTGCGRSGTSLLQRVISNHKNIYSFRSETHFFGRYYNIPSLKEVNIENLLESAKYTGAMEVFYKEFESNQDYENLALSLLSVMFHTIEIAPDMVKNKNYQSNVLQIYGEIKELDDYKNVSNRYEMFNLLANHLTIKSNKKRWADKSSVNMFNTHTILDFFPDAKFIEIYRDPRGVYYSWTRCPFKFFRLASPITCSEMWRKTSRLGEKLEKELNGKYYRIKYEDLLISPVKEVEKICNFIEEEFDPNMLQVKTTNSSFRQYNGKEGIDSQRTSHWKNSLSKSELIFIDFATRKNRTNLGYPDIAPRLTPINILPFLVFFTKLCLKAKTNPIKYIKKIIKEDANT